MGKQFIDTFNGDFRIVNPDGEELLVKYVDVKNSVVNRHSLDQLKDMKNLVGAEVGVAGGANARNILSNLDIEKLYLIDPYIPYDHFTAHIINSWKQSSFRRLSSFTHKIVRIYKKSHECLDEIPDNLDFVYIDGNHSIAYAERDISLYYKKIKDGGLLAGHDFECKHVLVAITEFCIKNNKQLFFSDTDDHEVSKDWWIGY